MPLNVSSVSSSAKVSNMKAPSVARFNPYQSLFNLIEHLFFRKTDDLFEIYATIDIAADSNKISGNELRDIIYNEAKTYQKIGDQTIDLKEFSITNLEGKKP